jgi:hypothetical protein
MNSWTKKSIEIAQHSDYLDKLLDVYPMNPETTRELDPKKWSLVEKHFNNADLPELISTLLGFELFPIKDSYVAYLKRDKGALSRNSKTVERLGNSLLALGLDGIKAKCSEPKETNRQIGPMFRNWATSGKLGIEITHDVKEFKTSSKDLILDLGDAGLKTFANDHLNYNGKKGIDLIAKIGNEYIVAEAKFLTDFGGHQNAQFNDAITLVNNTTVKAKTVAILDGVPYIGGNNSMSKAIRENTDKNIMSVLVLKEFLKS